MKRGRELEFSGLGSRPFCNHCFFFYRQASSAHLQSNGDAGLENFVIKHMGLEPV